MGKVVPNTVPSYNIASELRSKVSKLNAYPCNFQSLDYN